LTINGKKLKRKNPDLVSWTVFLITLSVVLVAITTLLFPALVIRSLGGVEDYSGINPFETGIWTFPLLITNLILLGIGILYFKNKLPKLISKSIKFIFDFEISAKVALLVILILIGVYITFSVDELFMKEQWPDFTRVKPALETWEVVDFTKKFDLHVKYLLGNISMQVFGSYRVIPFIASIALLILTYAITTEISKKRFAGLVSMVIVLQSGTFLTYDTSITYSNFWVFFYVLSLYVIYKKWPLSPLSFILSIFSKPLTIIFIPLTLFFICRAKISRRNKIFVAIFYIVIIIGIGFTVEYFIISYGITTFDSHDFWRAFNAFSYQMRLDSFIVLFLLPLTVGLFLVSKRNLQADSILVLIMGVILMQPIMAGLTGQSSEPYRFMPLIIFFGIGVGTLFSKKDLVNWTN